jgi:hypothetical protein
MKSKVVLWGENAANEKLLIGIELLERDNKILIHTIPHKVATEEFYQMMLDKWRENHDITWPAEKVTIERPLSMSDGLLPDEIKVDRTDVIARAQAEWHFIVLSNKLYETYKSEVDELKDKVDNLIEYSEDQWKDLVEFWGKVSNHLKEHTLFRDHGTILKERTNILFDKLKELKKTAQKQADVKSKELASELTSEINEIETKIKEGLGLGPLFDDLKKIQEKFKNTDLTRGDRNSIFGKIDAAFKALKEQKGSRPQRKEGGGQHHELSRTDSRLAGLLDAIKKMEANIKRDQNELDFQNKRIAQTEGKFEMQIRQAKIKIVEQSIESKQVKLDDMIKTRQMLESRVTNLKDKETKNEAKEQVKQKIAASIESNKKNLEDQDLKLEAAANEINIANQPKPESKTEINSDSILGAITAIAGGTIEDLVNTAKAIGDVIEDRIEDTIESITKSDDKKEEE